MTRHGWIGVVAALVVVCAMVGCESPDPDSGVTSKAMEERMREMERRAKESLPKTQQIALAQKVAPEAVKKAQTELRALSEYLQEPDGKIDMVTVNAIEAFQRRVGLDDNGLLNDETLRKLEEAAKNAPPPPPSPTSPSREAGPKAAG